MEKAKRLFAAFCIMAFTQAGYNYIQTLGSKSDFKLWTGLDDIFWLSPWWIFIYASIYFVLVGAGWVLENEEFILTFKRVFTAQIISFLFFLEMPVSYPRICFMTVQEGVLRWGFHLMHSIDKPNNTFPSMHVSLTCIVLHSLAKHGVPKWLCVGYTILVCLSTLFTRQHFALDIAGGVGVYLLTLWIFDAEKGFLLTRILKRLQSYFRNLPA